MKTIKSTSLIEVMVALVILSITMAGITNLFLGGKMYSRHSLCRFQAANLTRYLLDSLQLCVRQEESSPGASDGWDQVNNCLRAGSRPGPDQQLGLTLYHSTYQVSNGPLVGLRKVLLTIQWEEPAPWAIY